MVTYKIFVDPLHPVFLTSNRACGIMAGMMGKEMKEKRRMTTIIADTLQADGRVVFAYLYGSFLTESSFRDIDVFLFLNTAGEPFQASVSVKEKLAEAFTKAGLPKVPADLFDVRVINDAPYDFVIDILCKGALIVDKDPEIRTDVIERVSNEYRVNFALLDEAYK